MAGEHKAKAYELIVACALKSYLKDRESITREYKFPGVNMRTDVVVGPLDSPKAALLVTHSGSEVDYTKKLPRDVAELIELTCAVDSLPSTALIVFDRNILPALLDIAGMFFSAVVDMSDAPDSQRMFSISDSKLVSNLAINTRTDEQIQNASYRLAELLGGDGADYLKQVGGFIFRKVNVPVSANGRSFSEQAMSFITSREDKIAIPPIRHTRVRRGLGKLALFTDSERKRIYGKKLLEGEYGWAVQLGLVKRTLSKSGSEGRYRIVDPEIVSGVRDNKSIEGVLACLKADEIEYCISKATEKSALYIQRLRNSDYLAAAQMFVEERYEELLRTKKMAGILRDVYQEPKVYLKEYLESAELIEWHWLYTYLVALFKAASGKKQGFGTTVIAKLSGERRFRMQNSILSDLEYRSVGFPEELFEPLGLAMSAALKNVPKDEMSTLKDKVISQQLRNELEDKHLCHSINPLPFLIKRQLIQRGIDFSEGRLRSSLAEASGVSGNAGYAKYLLVKDTVIWWRSAHDRTNVTHKKKELQTKAIGLRIGWNQGEEAFEINSNIRYLGLVIDGDFEEQDLGAMARFGWDRFVYADEIGGLVEAIQ